MLSLINLLCHQRWKSTSLTWKHYYGASYKVEFVTQNPNIVVINENHQTYMEQPRWDKSHEPLIEQESRNIGAERGENKEKTIVKRRQKKNI